MYLAFLTPHEPMSLPPGAEESFASISAEKRRKCAAMISLLDQGVGRVLQALRDSGQEERTLVIFHSDNGAPPGNGSVNTPLRGHKNTLWEGGIRAPFVLQWKGTVPAGRVVDAPILSIDVLPIALAAANVRVPEEAKLDGANLLPFLTGKTTTPPERALFWRYGEQHAVRQGDWKLVRALDSSVKPPVIKTGLYDVVRDPAETHDRAAEHPAKVKALEALWREWDRQNVPALWGNESTR